MSVAVLEKLSQSADQKAALIESVGDLSKIELMANRVLLGIYIEPEKTRGGIILATKTREESIYQGTVGLVLKLGPTAFQDEPETNTYFHGQKVKVGDWVAFRPGDAKRVQIRGVNCRLVEDTLIDLVVADPDCITHRETAQ